jgi:hypothetical protein
MSQYGKKDIVKQTGKMSQTGCFFTIQIKKTWSFCHSYILSTPRAGEMENPWTFCLKSKRHNECSEP